MVQPVADPVRGETTSRALRHVFRSADKPTRQKLVAALPPEVVSLRGVQMYVDPRDNYTERMIWLNSEVPEVQSLDALTEIVAGRDAFVLDIGANCGAFTIPLAHAAGAGSRVIAFEPNPVMIGRLGHNVRLNGLGETVRIEGCALADSTGEALLNFTGNNYGQASLLPALRPSQHASTLVPLRRLRDFVPEAEGHAVSVLKIDVEGAEGAVLGPLLEAADWLPDAMLIETQHTGQWDRDLLGRIAELGYRPTLEAEKNTLFAH